MKSGTREQKLKRRIADNRELRDKEMRKTQVFYDRKRTIADAFSRVRMGFWCVDCQADFEVPDAKKMVRETVGDWPKAWYEAACPRCRRISIRHITDKHLDPYYHQSEVLRMQRLELGDAMLQPHDPRFREVYPKQWAKIEEEREMLRQRELQEQEELYG